MIQENQHIAKNPDILLGEIRDCVKTHIERGISSKGNREECEKSIPIFLKSLSEKLTREYVRLTELLMQNQTSIEKSGTSQNTL